MNLKLVRMRTDQRNYEYFPEKGTFKGIFSNMKNSTKCYLLYFLFFRIIQKEVKAYYSKKNSSS